jgi:hypothetical protein
VPQFLQATRSGPCGVVDCCLAAEFGVLVLDATGVSSLARSCFGLDAIKLAFAALAILLLKAGHPPQPSAPPAPLQCPPPGHDPGGCSASRYGRLAGWPDVEDADAAVGDVLLRLR